MNSALLERPQESAGDPLVVANLMNEQRFNRMMAIATTMASAALIPEHLLGKKKGGVMEYFTADEIRANCFLIVNQSFRWGMDPFAVMPETYVVGGKLAYQGKLIAGLINSLAGLEERLSYTFSGTKGSDDFTVTVSGKFKGAADPVTVEVSVGQAKTDNQMWKKDPEQKLVYTGATKWARRYCPEVILGILTDDDAEHIEMREATGRVVEPTAAPKVITGGATAPTETAPSKPATKRASRTAQPAKTVEAETEPAAEAGSEMPPRDEIRARIIETVKAAKVSIQTAEKKYREAGFLPSEDDAPERGFADTTDEELFAISQNPQVLAASATQGGDQ